MVSIPVDLFAGVHPRQTSMRMVDAKGRPLGREYYSEKHDKGLEADELVRGYETDEGKLVIVTDEELESVAPELSRDIELRRFVPKEQIAPAYYNRPYFLAPAGGSAKAYHLLAQTLQETGRVGVGTFVMRGHQYLVAILSDGNVLRAETLRFAAEIRSPGDVGLPKRSKPAAKDVRAFEKAIDSLARDELDMDELSDRYAAALEDLAEKKEKMHQGVVDIAAAAPEDEAEEGGGKVIDLMALLKQRVGAPAKPGRRASSAKRAARADRGARRARRA
ncbi:MAG TPA: Ku protein [Burkholderiales bacterium]|nr:Ku protein [Burkholderiales bacterium]